jgi:hypothetical protein
LLEKLELVGINDTKTVYELPDIYEAHRVRYQIAL